MRAWVGGRSQRETAGVGGYLPEPILGVKRRVPAALQRIKRRASPAEAGPSSAPLFSVMGAETRRGARWRKVRARHADRQPDAGRRRGALTLQ